MITGSRNVVTILVFVLLETGAEAPAAVSRGVKFRLLEVRESLAFFCRSLEFCFRNLFWHLE